VHKKRLVAAQALPNHWRRPTESVVHVRRCQSAPLEMFKQLQIATRLQLCEQLSLHRHWRTCLEGEELNVKRLINTAWCRTVRYGRRVMLCRRQQAKRSSRALHVKLNAVLVWTAGLVTWLTRPSSSTASATMRPA